MLFEDIDDVADAIVDFLVELANFFELGESRAFVGVAALLFIGTLESLSYDKGPLLCLSGRDDWL